MKLIKQFFWIVFFSFLGEVIARFLPIPVPGSVIGMILLFVSLHYHWIDLHQVEDVGNWLTDNMAIFFVPAGVGLMTNFDILADTWWQLLIIVLVSTLFMLVFVGKLVQTVKQQIEQKRTVERKNN